MKNFWREGKVGIIKKPFYPDRLQEERDKDKGKVLPVRLSEEELLKLQIDKKILHQPKDSTALKLLAEIGANVLHDRKTGAIIAAIFKNKSKNRRTGLEIIE